MSRLKSIPFLFAALFVFAVLSVTDNDLFWNAEISSVIYDGLHYPAFFTLQLLTLNLITRIVQNKLYALIYSFVASITCAIGLETLQIFIDRTFDLLDILVGLIGITHASIIFLRKELNVGKKTLYFVLIISAGILIFTFVNKIAVLIVKTRELPIIANFSEYKEIDSWRNLNHFQTPKLTLTRISETPINFALTGRKLEYKWTGVTYENHFGFDLAPYEGLSLRFFSPKSKAKLRLRFDDVQNNISLAKSQHIHEGWNVLMFPIPKKDKDLMNWSKIIKISLYYETNFGPNKYMLDDILLTK